MNREQFVLSVLAPSGTTPMTQFQIHRLVFVVYYQFPSLLDGPPLIEQTPDYKAGDVPVYAELAWCEAKHLIQKHPRDARQQHSYSLTIEGRNEATVLLASLPLVARITIADLSDRIQSLSFRELVNVRPQTGRVVS